MYATFKPWNIDGQVDQQEQEMSRKAPPEICRTIHELLIDKEVTLGDEIELAKFLLVRLEINHKIWMENEEMSSDDVERFLRDIGMIQAASTLINQVS